jgi:uncharacterized repeat protein (TIGR03803 family)
MKVTPAVYGIAGLVALGTAADAAPGFRVIATIGGGPAIGAIIGTTLYGTTPYGGLGVGSLFSLTTGGTYTLLHNFVGATEGTYPTARLAIGAGGAIWGTTQLGGANSGGTLFSYTAKGLSIKHSFGQGDDGNHPMQGPVADGTGAFIGTLSGGAYETYGSLYKYDTSGAYGLMHDFRSGPDGHCPFSGPSYTPTKLIYGTTVGMGYGGNPQGSIWRFNGKLTTVYAFKDGADGEYPDQAPVGDAHGNLYGTTHIQNGNAFAGAIWKITPAGVFTVMHSFAAATDGYQPNSPLILNTDGYLYGTTASGGPKNLGTVFRISTSGRFQVEHSFTGGADGGSPTGSLVNDTSGAIYGGTRSGTVFKITN